LDNDDISIGRDSSNNFTVIWLSRGAAGGPAAIVSRYNSSGTFLNKFSYNGNISGTVITGIAAAINDSGDVYLLWQGIDTDTHLYLTVLSKTGVIKSAAVEVPDVQNAVPQQPDIAVDNNRKAMAVWIDSRSGKRAAYYQVFNSNFTPAGTNLPVSATPVEFMQTPVVSTYQDRGWLAWADPRIDGLNIFSNTVLYAATDADDNKPEPVPSAFALNQNYPNPFNPRTTIRFSVVSRTRVEIDIIDILGRKVAIIADAEFPAGSHSVIWDGRDSAGNAVASGIYFYKMSAGGYISTRKMILLK
jgi:hypothetical protein